MIRGKYLRSIDADFQACAYIREEVFVKEQGYTKEEEFDDIDGECIHVLVFDESKGKPAATGRMQILENGIYKIGRVAVIKDYRGQHYGEFVMRLLMDQAKMLGAVTLKLSAQMTAVPFYERLGFCQIGETYMDGTILHIMMENKGFKKKPCCSGQN